MLHIFELDADKTKPLCLLVEQNNNNNKLSNVKLWDYITIIFYNQQQNSQTS